jgi:peptidyl-tRNA hydrolase, PTH1 family
MVLDELVRRHALEWDSGPSQLPELRVARKRGDWDGYIVKPLTFMNLSGDAVSQFARYFGVAAADTLIVVDEAQLPFGRLRARARGSAGGHNGLKSVIERLGTQEFPRLRLGVGRGDSRRDLADHVLSKFEPGERAELETFIARAADAAEMFAVDGIGKVMNTYNPEVTAPEID